MGGFAQAARRQGYLKDFSVNMQDIAKIIANKQLEQEAIEKENKRKKQLTDFSNFNVNSGNSLKELYDKSYADKIISADESANIAKSNFDYNSALANYDLIDPNYLKSASANFGSLADVYGKVTPEKKAIPYDETPLGIRSKRDFELRKMREENRLKKELEGTKGSEDRKTAGYKDSLDDNNSKNQSQLDRSKLRGQIAEGISKIKGIKQNSYNPQTVDDKGLKAYNPYYQVVDSNGKKINLNSKESVTAYKEQIKGQYAKPMQELITKAGLDDAVKLVRKGVDRGLSPEESLNQFINANANNLTNDDVQDLQNWFTLFGL